MFVGDYIPYTDELIADDVVPKFDSLEHEFRVLEREVLQRDCRHETEIDVTQFGGPIERMCVGCGRRADA